MFPTIHFNEFYSYMEFSNDAFNVLYNFLTTMMHINVNSLSFK